MKEFLKIPYLMFLIWLQLKKDLSKRFSSCIVCQSTLGLIVKYFRKIPRHEENNLNMRSFKNSLKSFTPKVTLRATNMNVHENEVDSNSVKKSNFEICSDPKISNENAKFDISPVNGETSSPQGADKENERRLKIKKKVHWSKI